MKEKKIGLVLLAAGSSIRYGGVKLLENVNGKRLYLRMLEKAAGLSCKPKIIVTQYEEIWRSAPEYGFMPLYNKNPELGISHSTQLGLTAAIEQKNNLEAVLFLACDQPFLKSETIKLLLEAYQQTEKGLACLCSEKKAGDPNIIGSEYFDQLFCLNGDKGGQEIIQYAAENVERVFVKDEKELWDIDTQEEMEAINRRF